MQHVRKAFFEPGGFDVPRAHSLWSVIIYTHRGIDYPSWPFPLYFATKTFYHNLIIVVFSVLNKSVKTE